MQIIPTVFPLLFYPLRSHDITAHGVKDRPQATPSSFLCWSVRGCVSVWETERETVAYGGGVGRLSSKAQPSSSYTAVHPADLSSPRVWAAQTAETERKEKNDLICGGCKDYTWAPRAADAAKTKPHPKKIKNAKATEQYNLRKHEPCPTLVIPISYFQMSQPVPWFCRFKWLPTAPM